MNNGYLELFKVLPGFDIGDERWRSITEKLGEVKDYACYLELNGKRFRSEAGAKQKYWENAVEGIFNYFTVRGDIENLCFEFTISSPDIIKEFVRTGSPDIFDKA